MENFANIRTKKVQSHRMKTAGVQSDKKGCAEVENHLLLQLMFRDTNLANPFRFTREDEVREKFTRNDCCPNCGNTSNFSDEITSDPALVDRFWYLSSTACVKIRYQNGLPVLQLFTSSAKTHHLKSMFLATKSWENINRERRYLSKVELTDCEVFEFLCDCRLKEIYNCITDYSVKYRSVEFELCCFQPHSQAWQNEGLPFTNVYMYADNHTGSLAICRHEIYTTWNKNDYSHHVVYLTFEELEYFKQFVFSCDVRRTVQCNYM
jgi:hypothetical protein